MNFAVYISTLALVIAYEFLQGVLRRPGRLEQSDLIARPGRIHPSGAKKVAFHLFGEEI